jgi:N-methylhydantoinase A
MKTAHIGVDIGGTFTDFVVVDEDGRVSRAKAATTPDDYSRAILTGLGRLAEAADTTLPELMEATELFINGTTIVTNSIAQLRGRRVGVLTTRGFGDTLRIARSARTNDLDLNTQISLPDIVDPGDIVEIDERVDARGNVIVALDLDQVRAAADELVARGCEAIAICFLWSFANVDHERAAAAAVEEAHPGLFVSSSNQVFPVAREYERLTTTVFNAFTSGGVDDYLDKLEGKLAELGCNVGPSMMQSVGGLLSPAEARGLPIALINSGPVGGVVGARALGERLGIDRIITGDIGGTSFDTALIKDGELKVAHRADIDRFASGVDMIDINAIGAGGGSILWLDQRNTPRMGPQSAGAVPGPVCYGQGGTEPTTTDMAVAMGLMDPNYFLGGRDRLDADASVRAIHEKIGGPLGWDEDRTLLGVHEIVIETLANAVRSISIRQGYDPREFTMVAYGGASGLFLAHICRACGISDLILPANAAVFSAYGLLWADGVRSLVQTVNWLLPTGSIEDVERVLDDLSQRAREALRSRNFDDSEIELTYEGDFRFAGQAFELQLPLEGPKLTEEDRTRLSDLFFAAYEAEYGPGTAWDGFPVMMLNARVTATGKVPKPALEELPMNGAVAADAAGEGREMLVPELGVRQHVPSYRGAKLTPGMTIEGPAVIDDIDTTVYIPADATCTVDPFRNYRVSL